MELPTCRSPDATPLQPFEGNVARIGRYDVTAGTWTWFLYPLETTSTVGDWIGLSEITVVDEVKRVYTVDLPAGSTSEPTAATKRLAVDVLPQLRALNGWTQEKLEGLTIGADNRVYAVTDNDGLEDATGETQLLRLGDRTAVFASATSLELAATHVMAGSGTTATVTVNPARQTGTVTLYDGATPIGSGTPDAKGIATIAVPALSIGTHSLTARWSGTPLRGASTSAAVALTVTKVVTTTTLTAPGKVRAGDKVKLTAVVTGATTGTVVFTAGGKTLGSASVTSGVATLRVRLKKGRHAVVATCAGSDTVAGSSSAPATVKVKPAKKKPGKGSKGKNKD